MGIIENVENAFKSEEEKVMAVLNKYKTIIEGAVSILGKEYVKTDGDVKMVDAIDFVESYVGAGVLEPFTPEIYAKGKAFIESVYQAYKAKNPTPVVETAPETATI